MNKSESIKELTIALSKAQGRLQNPAFDKTNPHFRNKYASLAAIRDEIIPILASEGITMTQWLSSGPQSLKCETMISHISGEWMAEVLELPVTKNDAQGFASAATYARRISMQSVVGVTGDEDDDGEAAAKAKPDPITARAGARDRVTEGQNSQIDRLASRILDSFAADDHELAFVQYLDARDAIRAYGADAQAAFWDKFDSKQRAALKKLLEAKKAKEIAEALGQQA